MQKVLLFLLAMFLSMPGMAGADLLVGPGVVGGSGDVDNVLFNGPGTISSGQTVSGFVSGNLIDFTGEAGETLSTPSQGQARIEATDGSFDYLKINFHDPSIYFSKIQFNINAENDGTVKLTFETTAGTTVYNDKIGKNGENFFTGIATNEFIRWVIIETFGASITSFGGMDDLRQIRVGVGANNPVPEPSTLLLLGVGILGVAGYGRKKLSV